MRRHPRRGHVPGEVLRGELPPVLSSEPSETDLASLVLEVAGADAASAAAGAGAVADAHSRARADSTVALAVRAVAETSCTLQEWLRSRADAVAVTIASRAAAAAHDAADAPLAAPR